jgi:hypothetical protein
LQAGGRRFESDRLHFPWCAGGASGSEGDRKGKSRRVVAGSGAMIVAVKQKVCGWLEVFAGCLVFVRVNQVLVRL